PPRPARRSGRPLRAPRGRRAACTRSAAPARGTAQSGRRSPAGRARLRRRDRPPPRLAGTPPPNAFRSSFLEILAHDAEDDAVDPLAVALVGLAPHALPDEPG